MSSRIGVMAAVGLIIMGFVVGCSDTTAGQATPGPTTTDSQTSTTNEESESDSPPGDTPTVEIPAPPENLSLEGVGDACSLLTEPQRTELKIDSIRPGTSGSSSYSGMKDCGFDVDSEPFHSYYVMAVTNEGIDQWLTGKRNVDADLTTIAGYPAAQFKTMGTEDVDCVVSVGVAEGQQLWVEMKPLTEFTQDQICQASAQAAEMAVATLQTLR